MNWSVSSNTLFRYIAKRFYFIEFLNYRFVLSRWTQWNNADCFTLEGGTWNSFKRLCLPRYFIHKIPFDLDFTILIYCPYFSERTFGAVATCLLQCQGVCYPKRIGEYFNWCRSNAITKLANLWKNLGHTAYWLFIQINVSVNKKKNWILN